MIYLTEGQIEEINRDITLAEGNHSITNAGALALAASSPGQVVFGRETNDSLGRKAAALVIPIAQSHPFQNGNKRTAFGALQMFLNINGYQIIQGRDESVRRLIGQCAAEEYIDKELLAGRLQMNCMRIGGEFIHLPADEQLEEPPLG